MNKKNVMKILALTMVIIMSFSMFAFAEGKTYLALGADLSDKEKATVLDIFKLDSTDGCEIITVTNADEHKYLDKYVSSEQIGSKALSSVMIVENDGDEINVDTHNITFCTEGMYKNALSTAGVSGADVVVAGPTPISGTAALVGTIKAYEEMTGEDVPDDVVEGSVSEITTTGEVGEEVGDKEGVEKVVSSVKSAIADNPDMSTEEIKEEINDAADQVGISLTPEQTDKLAELGDELKGLDIDWDNVKDKASGVLDKIENSGILDKIINWFKSLF